MIGSSPSSISVILSLSFRFFVGNDFLRTSGELSSYLAGKQHPNLPKPLLTKIRGLISACQAATKSWAGEMVLRFLLGVFEAGFGTGITYLLSFFYLRHEVGLRQGTFAAAAPLASCFAGALAYGITSGSNEAIAPWRVLFLVEGLPTIAMAPIVYFFLPDSPVKARFLEEDEKQVALARAVRQVGPGTQRIGSISFKNILSALADFKPWILALMYFSCNVSFASLPVFLPTILEEMGFSSINAQGLTAPPYFLAFLVTISKKSQFLQIT